jgi:uroporphyrinogen-III synthase
LGNLNGLRVGLLEARMSAELAGLIERAGGQPFRAPAVREAPLDASDGVARLIDAWMSGTITINIFLTGVGVKALLAEAEKLGRVNEVLSALQNTTNICRGPKPVAVLKKNNLPIALVADEPHTTSELLQALNKVDVQNKNVALLHYGERNQPLSEALIQRGAKLTELSLYEWQMPEDVEPLKSLAHKMVEGQLDAVAFTSQVQIRHLLNIARELNLESDLLEALQTKLIVASIGPTCTAALAEIGLKPTLEPEHPKMGHLAAALTQYVEAH